MLLPLGILASAGGAAADYELIETKLLATSSTVVSFTSIPSGYKHLQIRGTTRTTTVTGYTSAGFRFNSDSASNYSAHELVGSGGSVSSGGGANQTSPFIWRISGGSLNSNIYGTAIIDILDYADTNKYKTVRCLSGMEGGSGNALIQLTSGSWRNTAAVTGVSFHDASGGNFAAGSRFSIYGLKG